MKLNETDALARRIGPLRAVDVNGNPVTDFSAPGTVTVAVNGGAFGVAGGTMTVIGSGYAYYNATPTDASVRGYITVKLEGVCQEYTLREEVELAPQGILVNEASAAARHLGPLRLVDINGNELASLAGVTAEVSRNGAAWAAATGATTMLETGYADYGAAAADVTSIGWLAVRLTGACQEFVFRSTIVAETSLFIPAPVPIGPVLPEDDAFAIAPVAGDLALVWSNTTGDADLSVLELAIDEDLATDRGLATAVLLSLFTDRRAENDDKPPSGDDTDRRGWWADQFAAVEGDKIGSRLWLLDRSKRRNETVLRAQEYVREALAWMLEDRVVASIDVEVETTSSALLMAIGLQRPGRDPVSFRFAHAWEQEAA